MMHEQDDFQERRAIFRRCLENLKYNRKVNSRSLGFKYYMTTRMILLIERSRDILTADELSHYMDQILEIKNDSIANGCKFDLNLSPNQRFYVALRSFELMQTIHRMENAVRNDHDYLLK
jgi:hypothetical protein